jgi:hypothetical protein
MNLTRTLEGQYGPKLQNASEEELVGLMSSITLILDSRYDRRAPNGSTFHCIEKAETDELLMNLAATAYRMRFPIDPLPEDRAIAA